ncbi:MAG: hypothetical protein HY764_03640 [Candidatus Portnoybacteria bacterium]|nr:hypothetical protein [Candidatus Portnoybacteria bacterium]
MNYLKIVFFKVLAEKLNCFLPFLDLVLLPDLLAKKWSWPIGRCITFLFFVILKRFRSAFFVFPVRGICVEANLR